MRARYFRSPEAFRAWLEQHHDSADAVLVGFYKKHTGKPSMSWSHSVDEALCVGWIDGIRHRVDEDRYTIRFTPRRKGSVWSAVNLKKAKALIAAGRMKPAGHAAYRARDPARSKIYSYEQKDAKLAPAMERRFKQVPDAWDWFKATPPGYRRTCIRWVMSAKLAATRERRLAILIECSGDGLKIPAMR